MLRCPACEARVPERPGTGRLADVGLPVLLGSAVIAGLALVGPCMPSSPGDDVAAQSAHAPHARVDGTTRGELEDGGVFWLFTYVNDGPVPIRHPTVEVRAFDAAGAVVARARATAPAPDVLEPGASVPMRVTLETPPPHVTTRLQPVPPHPAEHPPAMRALSVQGVTHHEDGSVTGELVVLGQAPVRVEDVAVLGVRRDGRIVRWAEVDLQGQVVTPDRPLPFRAQEGPHVTVDAAAWTAFAWGTPHSLDAP